MPRAQFRAADAKGFRHTRAQIVDQDVGGRGQLLEGGEPVCAFHVERDRPFATVEDREGKRVVVAKRAAHPPCIVAALDPLDLQHLGAKVGEDRAREGRRQHLPNADPLQDAHG